jgi:putative FmdB family regulatory protein
MPTYEYRCKDCRHEFEAVQSFTDDALTECPQCHGPLRKVFGNVGISFKGSGFYKTDHGSKSKATAGSSSAGGDSGGSSSDASSKGDSSSKSESTSSSADKSAKAESSSSAA